MTYQDVFNNELEACLQGYSHETLPDELTVPLSIAFSVIAEDY